MEKNVFEKFMDAAEAVVGKAEKAFGTGDELWEVHDIIDERGTTYQVRYEDQKIECWDARLAQRVCDALNG